MEGKKQRGRPRKEKKEKEEMKEEEKEIYCGYKEDLPRNRRHGTMKECAEMGKVSRYGRYKIDPVLGKTVGLKKKTDMSASKLWVKIVGLKAQMKQLVEKVRNPKKTEEEKDGYRKEYAKLREELEQTRLMREEKLKKQESKTNKKNNKKNKEEVKEEIKKEVKEVKEVKEGKKEDILEDIKKMTVEELRGRVGEKFEETMKKDEKAYECKKPTANRPNVDPNPESYLKTQYGFSDNDIKTIKNLPAYDILSKNISLLCMEETAKDKIKKQKIIRGKFEDALITSLEKAQKQPKKKVI